MTNNINENMVDAITHILASKNDDNDMSYQSIDDLLGLTPENNETIMPQAEPNNNESPNPWPVINLVEDDH